MSEPTEAPVVTAPAPKLNAIQMIEQDIARFISQREQAIANVHAIEGALQATQHLLARLKAEALKAETEAKKLAGEAETEVKTVVGEVESKVVSIESAVKKEL